MNPSSKGSKSRAKPGSSLLLRVSARADRETEEEIVKQKQKSELEDLENSNPINIGKRKRERENRKGATGQSLYKECDSLI